MHTQRRIVRFFSYFKIKPEISHDQTPVKLDTYMLNDLLKTMVFSLSAVTWFIRLILNNASKTEAITWVFSIKLIWHFVFKVIRNYYGDFKYKCLLKTYSGIGVSCAILVDFWQFFFTMRFLSKCIWAFIVEANIFLSNCVSLLVKLISQILVNTSIRDVFMTTNSAY